MDPALIPSCGDGVMLDKASVLSPSVRTPGSDTGAAELTTERVCDLSQVKIDIMQRFMTDV